MQAIKQMACNKHSVFSLWVKDKTLLAFFISIYCHRFLQISLLTCAICSVFVRSGGKTNFPSGTIKDLIDK